MSEALAPGTRLGPYEIVGLIGAGPGVLIARRPEDINDRDLSWLDSSSAADLSLDGRMLLFTETGQGGGPEGATYLRGMDGTPAVRLGAGRAIALSPDAQWALSAWAVSPDGSTIAAREPDGPIRLYPVDGSAPRVLEGTDGTESPIGWIREGLLITRPGDPALPGGEIYKVDIGSGRQVPWKNILPLDRAGIMILTSFRVTPDGSAQAYSWHRALSDPYVADGL